MHRLWVPVATLSIAIGIITSTTTAQVISGLPTPKHIDVPEGGVEVPMLQRGSMPAVEVKVNGEGPFLFAIDTGGMGLARADASLVKELQLPVVGQITGGDGSGQNSVQMDVVEIEELQIGTATFRGIQAPSRDYNRSGLQENIDGMLGINIFIEHLLVLDHLNNKVRIQSGKLDPPDGQTIFALVDDSPIPTMRLPLSDEKSVDFHLDTGNMGGITLPNELADAVEFESDPIKVGEARTLANTFEIKQGKMRGDFLIGAHQLTSPLVNLLDGPMRPNLGSQVLKNFTLTFDQKQGRVKFDRGGKGPINSVAKPRLGVALATSGDSVIINATMPNSAAEKSGLMAGDELVAVNGTAIADMQQGELHKTLTSGQPVTLAVDRHGQQLEIVVDPTQ